MDLQAFEGRIEVEGKLGRVLHAAWRQHHARGAEELPFAAVAGTHLMVVDEIVDPPAGVLFRDRSVRGDRQVFHPGWNGTNGELPRGRALSVRADTQEEEPGRASVDCTHGPARSPTNRSGTAPVRVRAPGNTRGRSKSSADGGAPIRRAGRPFSDRARSFRRSCRSRGASGGRGDGCACRRRTPARRRPATSPRSRSCGRRRAGAPALPCPRGTLPPCSATSVSASFFTFFAFVGARPQVRMRVEDLVDAQARHRFRRRRAGEKRRRDLVHLRVRRLRGEQHGHEQRERIAMREWDRRLRDRARRGSLRSSSPFPLSSPLVLGIPPLRDELRQRRRFEMQVHRGEDFRRAESCPRFERMTVRM